MKKSVMIRQAKNLMLNSYYLLILLLLPILIISYYLIVSLKMPDVLSAFGSILSTSIYCFSITALVSFEYFYKIRSSNLQETINVTIGERSWFASQFIVMLSYCALLFILTTLIGLFISFSYKELSMLWLIQMVLNTFLSFFLIPSCACLIGMALSKTRSRAASYAFLIIFIILTTKLSNDVAYVLSESGMNIFPIITFFDIFTPSLNWTPVYAFGQNILPYRWYIVLFWLFLMCFISQIKHNNKSTKDKIVLSTSLILTVTFLCLSLTPMSTLILSSDDPQRSIMSDQDYYDPTSLNFETEKANFIVSKYDLKIKVQNQLEIVAKLSVDTNNLNEYNLTLYHGYKVEKVTFDDGTPAIFLQDGDYLTIYSNNKISESYTIHYSGYSPIYYSNLQGMFLPGYFTYYPLSGKRSVYDIEYLGMSQNRLDEKTLFNVKVSSNLKVFSNLPCIDDNEFSGYADGLTLLSGMYKTYTDENLTVVYPYLNPQNNDESIIENIVENYGTDYLPKSTKTVLITPSINNLSPYTSYCLFNDSVVIQSIFNIDLSYKNQMLSSNKQALYTTYMIYLKNSEDLRQSLKMQEEGFKANFPDLIYEKEMENNISYLIVKFLDYHGEDIGKELIEQYLFSSDTDDVYWKDFIQTN